MYDINQVEYGQHVGHKYTSINNYYYIYRDIINYWATPSYVPMSNTASHDTMSFYEYGAPLAWWPFGPPELGLLNALDTLIHYCPHRHFVLNQYDFYLRPPKISHTEKKKFREDWFQV